MITLECRNESHEITDKQKRRKDILSVLANSENPLTAMEIAEKLLILGKVDRVDRNYVSPRMTEMCIDGTVEPAGKKLCSITGRKVTMFRMKEI